MRAMVSGIVTPKDEVRYAKPTSIRLPVDLLERIDAIGKETGRSRNEVIAMLLEYALSEHEKRARRTK